MSAVGSCLVGLSRKVKFWKRHPVDPVTKHLDGSLVVPGSKGKLVSSPSRWDSDDRLGVWS